MEETIQCAIDSINEVVPLLRELAANSDPEPYTVENLNLTKFNIIISVVAAIFAIIGTYYGKRGYDMAKLTAIGVERIGPETEHMLITLYFRYILTSYLRLLVVYRAFKEKGQIPEVQYVNSVLLPNFNDFYHTERFFQFKGCKIWKKDGHNRTFIENKASSEAVMRLKSCSLDIDRYKKQVELMGSLILDKRTLNNNLCRTVLKKINDIILYNFEILSYIDGNNMSQCNYYLGRRSILEVICNYYKKIDKESVNKRNYDQWHGIIENLMDDKDTWLYKLINNENFEVDKYIADSDYFRGKGIDNKEKLSNFLIEAVTYFTLIQVKYYSSDIPHADQEVC